MIDDNLKSKIEESKNTVKTKKFVKGKSKAVVLALWQRFKGQRAADKLKMLVQTTVATAAIGGLAVAGTALAQAQEAQEHVNRIDPNTIVTIPTPPDLTAAVEQAQQSADAAKAAADAAQADADQVASDLGVTSAAAQAAQASADAAKAAADAAKAAADAAQASANEALAAIPRLYAWESKTVNNADLPGDPDQVLGSFPVAAGTYMVHLGGTFPTGVQSVFKITFSDGRSVEVTSNGAGGYREVRALLTVPDTAVIAEVNVTVHPPGPGTSTFTNLFSIFTKLSS